VRRWIEAGEAYVHATFSDSTDRNQGHPHGHAKIISDPGSHRGERLATQLPVLSRHRKTGPIATKHEWEIGARQSIRKSRDHRGSGGVHGLVVPSLNSQRRLHDVRNAQDPTLRKGNVDRRFGQLSEAFEDREALVKASQVTAVLRVLSYCRRQLTLDLPRFHECPR
jgi:hypothetical protein